MLDLFVIDAASGDKIPAHVRPASEADLKSTKGWQTYWKSRAASKMPNKVALHVTESEELLGLMSYEILQSSLAVEVIYVESAAHSNMNLVRAKGLDGEKRFIGIAKALFAYAVDISMKQGFDGVLVFRAKTTELLEYYIREFGARQVGAYDPFQLVIWEDAAEEIISEYWRDD